VPLIERLNGALFLDRSTQAVKFGGAARIGEDGDVIVTVSATVNVQGRSRASAIAEVISADGTRTERSPPSMSAVQRLAAAADVDDELGDLLAHLARADNWYDLYKTIEFLERIGRGEHELAKSLDEISSKVKLAKSTANFYRHARAHRPPAPSTFGDAKAIVAEAITRILRRSVY
jgi:hypothetical protein